MASCVTIPNDSPTGVDLPAGRSFVLLVRARGRAGLPLALEYPRAAQYISLDRVRSSVGGFDDRLGLRVEDMSKAIEVQSMMLNHSMEPTKSTICMEAQ